MTKYFFKKYDNFKKTDCCKPIEFYDLLKLIKYAAEEFNYNNQDTDFANCSIYTITIKYVGYDYDIYHDKFILQDIDSNGERHIVGYMTVQNI